MISPNISNSPLIAAAIAIIFVGCTDGDSSPKKSVSDQLNGYWALNVAGATALIKGEAPNADVEEDRLSYLKFLEGVGFHWDNGQMSTTAPPEEGKTEWTSQKLTQVDEATGEFVSEGILPNGEKDVVLGTIRGDTLTLRFGEAETPMVMRRITKIEFEKLKAAREKLTPGGN